MKKSLKLLIIGFILLALSVGFGVYSNVVYDTAQCIATFEGQNSFVCRAGGSSTATIVLQALFFIGLLLVMIGVGQYYRTRRTR